MALRYTPQQLQAIGSRRRNLLILACAGSGKTEVISRRIAHLVKEGVAKSAIIAFTFTERAAAELKARIRRHLEEEVRDDPAIGDMYVGTIHSFCLQLLKEIDPDNRRYEVMDDARQAALVMANFRRFDDGDRGIGLDRLRHRTRRQGYGDTLGTFLSTLNIVHQCGLDPNALGDPELADGIRRYRRLASEWPNFFLDFNEIIHRLIERLQTDTDALERVRNRFEHLVVDEYQDVDGRQEELIRLITDTGRQVLVTAVGDDDQALYGWRGARIENILNFESVYPNVHRVELLDNFRSTHAIVEIANNAIRLIPAGARIQKDMLASWWPPHSDGDRPLERLAERGDVQMRELPDEEAEASWIAERILQLRGTVIEERDGTRRAIDYADFAILLRSVKSSGRLFANELRRRGISVVVKGAGGLFEHDEVRLVHATFCLLARSEYWLDTEDGFQRLDEAATRQFIRDTLGRLRDTQAMPQANPVRFLEWIAEERETLDRRMLSRMERGHLARRIYPQDLFQDILLNLGSAAGDHPWRDSVLYNLGRLSRLIMEFEAVHQWVTPRNLLSLCIYLGTWAAGKVDEGGPNELMAPNAVQILTVHGAKGLEWPAVFLPRVCSRIFPSNRRNQGPETFLPDDAYDRTAYIGGDDGERRLWYVALTRCQRYLNITSVRKRGTKPSEFFEQVRHDYAQRQGAPPPTHKGNPTPPANAELLPTTYTDLSYFWRCPFEYQLRSLMGFSPGVKESYGYGQQIHNVLAEIHDKATRGEVITPDEAVDLLNRRFHLRYTRDGETLKPFTRLREAAAKTLRRYIINFSGALRDVVVAEKPFEFVDQSSGALISGTIDLVERVEREPGGETRVLPMGIVDFKTHSFRKSEEYQATVLSVSDQLRLYALAARQALSFEASRARAHLLSPREIDQLEQEKGIRETIDVDVSAPALDAIAVKVREAVRDIRGALDRRSFPCDGPRSGHCRSCDFRKICPGYRIWDASDRVSPRPPTPEREREMEIDYITEDVDAGSQAQ